jgi:putative membrane protein
MTTCRAQLLVVAATTFCAVAAFAQSPVEPPPTDAQIFGILKAANTGEISEAQLAFHKTSNPRVTQLAQQMIQDHTKMSDQGRSLAGKLGVTPEESPRSLHLKRSTEQELAMLHELSGSAFNKAYVDDQVKAHRTVLHMFDKTLIPSARNPQLRAMLQQARPIIDEHLHHALRLQAVMSRNGAVTTQNP